MRASAETRISERWTPTSVACSSRGAIAKPAAASSPASSSAKAALRATWFSHSLLWDSWIDIEVPRPRFVLIRAGSIWRS